MKIFPRRPEADAAESSPEDQRTGETGATPIGQVLPRQRVSVIGSVSRIRTLPRTGLPSLAVTIEDPTGMISVVWSGRRAIGGITLGRRIRVEGIAVANADQQIGTQLLSFHNPAYELLSSKS